MAKGKNRPKWYHDRMGNRTLPELAQSVHEQSIGSSCIDDVSEFERNIRMLRTAIVTWQSPQSMYDAVVLALITAAFTEGNDRLRAFNLPEVSLTAE